MRNEQTGRDKVALADARAAGALIVDDASLVPAEQLKAARLVVQRCVGADRGFGIVIKDTRGSLSSRTVQAPAPTTPDRVARGVAIVALTEANAAFERAHVALLQLGEDECASLVREMFEDNITITAALARPGNTVAS